MKNKFSKNKFGTFISIALALLVAIAFWLVMKYMDSLESNDINNSKESALLTDYYSEVL